MPAETPVLLEEKSVKQTFIVHQHHHYGWTTNERDASAPDDAMRADILHYHDWLPQYSYNLIFVDGRYKVDYADKPRRVFGGGYQYAGYWFGDQIRIGQSDDCGKCGGTGINHYNPFHQCWNCGDRDAPGRSSGKLMHSKEMIND